MRIFRRSWSSCSAGFRPRSWLVYRTAWRRWRHSYGDDTSRNQWTRSDWLNCLWFRVVVSPHDHPPTNRALLGGMLMMILRGQWIAVIRGYFSATSRATVDSGERCRSTWRILGVKRLILACLNIYRVFVESHDWLLPILSPTCVNGLTSNRRASSGRQFRRSGLSAFRRAKFRQCHSGLVPRIRRFTALGGLTDSLLHDLVSELIPVSGPFRSCSGRHWRDCRTNQTGRVNWGRF
jgi:hypothetical protein